MFVIKVLMDSVVVSYGRGGCWLVLIFKESEVVCLYFLGLLIIEIVECLCKGK